MIVNVNKCGKSFKGAMAYYLHDKRTHWTDRHPTTSLRVAWVEVRNIFTDKPDIATRIMIATAQLATVLKRRAGVKLSGRKSVDCVYSYSLSWHPRDASFLTRETMVRAADESLLVLGASHLQAMIVCHTDEPHPHLHVIVNRVDPENGKLHSVYNDYEKLQAWAADFDPR